MPTAYKNIFATNDMIVHYRLKPDGVYEARFHRKGINIEVSSKDLTKLKQKFIDKLNNKTYEEPKPKKQKQASIAFFVMAILKPPDVQRTPWRSVVAV